MPKSAKGSMYSCHCSMVWWRFLSDASCGRILDCQAPVYPISRSVYELTSDCPPNGCSSTSTQQDQLSNHQARRSIPLTGSNRPQARSVDRDHTPSCMLQIAQVSTGALSTALGLDAAIPVKVAARLLWLALAPLLATPCAESIVIRFFDRSAIGESAETKFARALRRPLFCSDSIVVRLDYAFNARRKLWS